MDDIIRIVTFDGGGIRGALSAKLLELLEQEVNFLSKVHVFAGTSTGSLIALGLAYGLTPAHLTQLYNHFGASSFKKNEEATVDESSPFYDHRPLQNLLREHVFKSHPKLKELKKLVIVPSFRLHDVGLGRWCPYVFHNLDASQEHDHDVVDVALASSAAPTFFPSYQGFVDGGVYANNPSMIALTYFMKYKKVPLSKIRLLSFGTGTSPNYISEMNLAWGTKQWMKGSHETKLKHPFFTLLTEGAVDVPHEQCEVLLQEQYKRVAVEFREPIGMDDVSQLTTCFEYAEKFPHEEAKAFSDLKAWIRDVFLD